ncbi:MAG TPA: DNA mismatch endonuclease Vsr [Candidatus Didemnitutus sp.]|nr:DNA mismatch endonuclease Vsr [Candidatus Didemnitutus sp.]
MADIFSKKQRSALMSRIRSRGNATTELALVRMLRAASIKGWRRHRRMAGGAARPDFIFPSERVCIFVDGCFWHGCPKCFRAPKSNVAYWREKIARNRRRDRRTTRLLRTAGFRVVRVWECRLKSPRAAKGFVARLAVLIGHRLPDQR